jgi:hypothetical protein
VIGQRIGSTSSNLAQLMGEEIEDSRLLARIGNGQKS